MPLYRWRTMRAIVQTPPMLALPMLALPMLALLAACGPAPDAAPATAAPDANGYAAKVAALPVRLRAGVLLRAIRDAGQDCQQVTEAERAPGQPIPQPAGRAAWVATCDDHRQWVVVVADDGTATVADARDVARAR